MFEVSKSVDGGGAQSTLHAVRWPLSDQSSGVERQLEEGGTSERRVVPHRKETLDRAKNCRRFRIFGSQR